MDSKIGGTWMLAALTLAACSTGGGASSTAGRLSGDKARQFGIERYVVEANRVILVGQDGATIGTLKVSAPSATARNVEIAYAKGESYLDEVTGGIDGQFVAPLPDTTREEAIQLDPALADFFLGHGLAFEVAVPTTEVTPSATAYCQDVTWTSGCGLCPVNSTWWPCSNSYFVGGNTVTAFAFCPPRSCTGSPVINDIVKKSRTCYTNNPTCTQQAYGVVGCGQYGTCDPDGEY